MVDRRGVVPAARHQAGEQAVLGGILVEVKKVADRTGWANALICASSTQVGLACEALPHLKVIEIEQILAAYLIRQRHDPFTGQWSSDE